MHTKRLTVPNTWTKMRKERKWALTPAPGPHKKFESIPVGMLLRDNLKQAENTREVKTILNAGMIKVDGKTIKNRKRAVGLMDSVQIGDDSYRVLPSTKGLMLITIPAKEAGTKIVKVIAKTMVDGRVQLNLHDGKNILSDKKDIKVGDSLLLSLPDLKIGKHVPLVQEAQVLIMSGKHAGTIATLKDRKKAPFHPDQAILEAGRDTFETTFDYLMAVSEVTLK